MAQHRRRMKPWKVIAICVAILVATMVTLYVTTEGTGGSPGAEGHSGDSTTIPMSPHPGTATSTTSGHTGSSGTSESSGITTGIAEGSSTAKSSSTQGATTNPAQGVTTSPSGPSTNYRAFVAPSFSQSPTSPLSVTYGYSASASTLVDGTWVAMSSLPAGTLQFYSDGSMDCSVSVGEQFTGSTCTVTYSTFGPHTAISNYIVNGTTYISVLQTNMINPFATTTHAVIHGGGAVGGLVLDADVSDSLGHAVAAGAVSMVVSDTTQGWTETVSGLFGEDGADPSAFSCLFIENAPRVGEYQGCGLSGPIVVIPGSGDTITLIATYAGASDGYWTGSTSTTTTYSFP